MANFHLQQAQWVSTGDPETVDDSPSKLFAPGQVGRYLTVKQPTSAAPGDEAGRDKTYRYVHTDSGMSVAPFKGAVAWWKSKAKYQVTTDATNRNLRAGVFQGPVTKGNYGFIQTGGPAVVKFIDAPTATPNVAGRAVIPSATAGKADCLGVATAPTHNLLGWVAGNPNFNAAAVEAIVELDIPDNP